MIRQMLTTRRGWLAWACALALAVRMLVPAGYMPAQIGGMPAITICDGTGASMVMTMPAMPGMGEKHRDPGKQPTSSCPFAIAAMAALGSVDAIVLVTPIVAPFKVGPILGQPTPRLRTARLRPPAQGPPAA